MARVRYIMLNFLQEIQIWGKSEGKRFHKNHTKFFSSLCCRYRNFNPRVLVWTTFSNPQVLFDLVSQKSTDTIAPIANHIPGSQCLIFEHKEIFLSHCAEQRCGVKAAISSRTQYINHWELKGNRWRILGNCLWLTQNLITFQTLQISTVHRVVTARGGVLGGYLAGYIAL